MKLEHHLISVKAKEDTRKSGLQASLGLFDAVAVSVGAIIGGGIFVVTGVAAGVAGSAVVVSMVVAACVSLLTALSFCELAAWQPLEGSIYEYSYRLISPFAGFLTGWMWVLSNTFAGAAVALGFAYYLNALYPILPANIVAALIAACFTVFNYLGSRQSALLNNFLVVAKLLILAFFVAFGLSFIQHANYVPFQPLQAGVLLGAVYIFFAFGGFARAAVIAEEIKDARRNVPRAILIALAISTVVYVLVGLVAVGLIGANGLSSSNSPLRDAMAATGNNAAVAVISVGGMLATASVLLTSILGVSRMAYAMARRNDLPQALSKLHPKHNTPYLAVWIVGAATVLLALIGDVSRVVVVSSFAMLFFYTLANVAAFRLKPQKRLFPRILPATGAAIGIAFLAFTFFASFQSWLVGVACLIIGALYYSAKRKHSKHAK
jgi:APA family basic amino acid/polyamine antiporter